LSELDWSYNPQAPKRDVLELGTLKFIDAREDVLLIGKPGTGKSHVAKDARSMMSIVFRLPNEELEEKFVAEAKKQRMTGLMGHRSVGGIRVSVYNSCPMEAAEAVTSFMKELAKANG